MNGRVPTLWRLGASDEHLKGHGSSGHPWQLEAQGRAKRSAASTLVPWRYPQPLGVQIFAGTDEGVTHTFTGANDAFTFYNFQATNGNVLLQEVSGVTAVPEPATWGMMLLGFAGLGFISYRGRRSRIHQDSIAMI